ncbi:MAG: cupin domain-containing protein [Candidatus Poribacteria bacterium]|nr:cupin domain-containing protein [Candidatus Poribacteria bacterium]
MHVRYVDLPAAKSVPGGTILEYPTQTQDCRTLERFAIRTLESGMHTPEITHHSHESFWIVTSGEGTMRHDGENFDVRARDMIITPPGAAHSLTAGDSPVKWFDLAFHSAVWKIAADALENGVGEPHGDVAQDRPSLIQGETLPPQVGDTCYRYPHARPHSTLDHWDQNSSEPGARAADHVHESHEEFWYIHEGSGHVEQNGRIFEVSAGDLIGHAPGVHHTLIAEKESIRWYCFCMNRWLMPLVKDALAA